MQRVPTVQTGSSVSERASDENRRAINKGEIQPSARNSAEELEHHEEKVPFQPQAQDLRVKQNPHGEALR